MTADRPTGPATLWTNEHRETFREVVWTDSNGRQWKTGVQEDAARAIEARILAALPEALATLTPGPFDKRLSRSLVVESWKPTAAALAAAIESILSRGPGEEG